MKMIYGLILAVLMAFTMTACGDATGDGLTNMFPITKGDKGDKGDTGATGLSAYDIWVENGNEGTEEDFIASLVGSDGLSAYELAVENGYTGTVEEWLQSLVGAPGTPGADGEDGADGICPDCNATIEPPLPIELCPPKLDDNDTRVYFIYYHVRKDLDGYTIQYFTDTTTIPKLRTSTDVTEDEEGTMIEDRNGTTIIRGYVDLNEEADSHGIGLTFDKNVSSPEEPE